MSRQNTGSVQSTNGDRLPNKKAEGNWNPHSGLFGLDLEIPIPIPGS